MGIDANCELEDVCNVVFDAFEYYGVNVTRVAQQSLLDDPVHQAPPPSHRYSIMTTATSGSNGEREAMSTSFISTGSGDVSTAEMYANRRISMGVYGVFTRLD